jgi:heme oxygenase (biliverdin-IX-beta and delta-forming)
MIATPHSSPSSLRFRLREATAEAHRRVEASMALTERCSDRASYSALLADLLGLYAPIEAGLAAVEWGGLGIDVAQRAKAPWLRADLMALGHSSRDIAALPSATQLPSILCPADAFGVFYVLEGATLGGQLILRQIIPSLGVTENAGARFFASYGADVGERWRSFTAALTAYGDCERRARAIERAALATFDSFLLWIDERAPRSTEGAPHVR